MAAINQPEIARLEERLRLRERQINTVHAISAALSFTTDLDAMLRETLRVALETVEADAGSLLIYEESRNVLVFAHVIGKTQLIGQEIDPEADRVGKVSTVFRTAQPLLTADAIAEGYNTHFDHETGYKTYNMMTAPLMNRGGRPLGVMQALNKNRGFTMEDLELLEIVCSLAATSLANARLAEEAQLAAVARAVGDLSHDIKNSLTPIETMVDTTVQLFLEPLFINLDDHVQQWSAEHPTLTEEILQIARPLRDWYPEMQESIKDGCTDIRELVSQISDYAKGTQSPFFAPNSIAATIHDRLRRLQVVARDRRVMLHLDGIEEAPAFAFDRRLVGRAVYNLVNNALCAINDAVRKGTLELRAFHIFVRASVVTEGEFPKGGYCLIEVEDDGPGIPQRVRESLFTPHTISTTQGGTGIGTRFVKSVADAHGGQVGVRSEPGQGACFWLKLPLSQKVTLP